MRPLTPWLIILALACVGCRPSSVKKTAPKAEAKREIVWEGGATAEHAGVQLEFGYEKFSPEAGAEVRAVAKLTRGPTAASDAMVFVNSDQAETSEVASVFEFRNGDPTTGYYISEPFTIEDENELNVSFRVVLPETKQPFEQTLSIPVARP